MIPLKTAREIKIMQEGGRKLAWVFEQLKIKPGMSLKEIDISAEELIKKQNGKPSFKMVKDYHWATCLNVNQGVVHGIPNDYRLKIGDLLSIDIGIFYKGYHTDKANSLLVGDIGTDQRLKEKEFLSAGKEALEVAINSVRLGNRIGHLSQAIQTTIESKGWQPVQALAGHGVGKKLHELPQIPCYLQKRIEETEKLKSDMTLAIEVIYTQGNSEVMVGEDGWTVETVDGHLAALFEDTILVTQGEPLVLTRK